MLSSTGQFTVFFLVEQRRGGGDGGDLISPQQDPGSTLGFSQHNYSRTETKRERVGTRAKAKKGKLYLSVSTASQIIPF